VKELGSCFLATISLRFHYVIPLHNHLNVADGTRYDYSHGFDILVGPEKKQLYAHHDVLVKRSDLFEAARASCWLGDPHTPTYLSEHDPEEFSDYLHLVYTDTIVLPDAEVSKWIERGALGNEWITVQDALNSHFRALINLYVLVDKLQDPRSVNLIMDGFIKFCSESVDIPKNKLKKDIYDLTPPGSPLRSVIRDLMIYETNLDNYEVTNLSAVPKQLLFDIAKEHLYVQQQHHQQSISEIYNQCLKNFPKCHYHQHNDKHPKCEQ
jgi:hypothetical protein